MTFAVMEIECRDSWEWFLHHSRICIIKYKNLTIISGQNSKIPSVVKEIFLGAHHDFCIINLSKNFMIDVGDKDDTKLFWTIGRAPAMYKV